jgi:predicted DsbA family dithiol-disulfide isomerase
MATISVQEFTDPACPFAFSAEPRMLAMRWRYGDQLDWKQRMIVLSEESKPSHGSFTPEMLSAGLERFAREFGMPIDAGVRPYMSRTIDACRAVIAAEQYAPDQAPLLVRALRVENMGNRGMLDDPELIARAATTAGIDPVDLEAWAKDPDVEIRLRADIAAARDPKPAALAQKQRLAKNGEDGWRYTAPSLLYTTSDGRHAEVAGFQSTDSYEAVLANLDPTLERRAAPESAAELLAWAPYPLATAEVAELLEVSLDEARAQLSAVATEESVGQDGYWTLSSTAAPVA